MPSYDVECSDCGYEAIVTIKLADLAAWDLAAVCPEAESATAHAKSGNFRRVIKTAPASIGTAKPTRPRMSSADKDTMKHKQFLNTNHDQIAAARESALKGE